MLDLNEERTIPEELIKDWKYILSVKEINQDCIGDASSMFVQCADSLRNIREVVGKNDFIYLSCIDILSRKMLKILNDNFDREYAEIKLLDNNKGINWIEVSYRMQGQDYKMIELDKFSSLLNEAWKAICILDFMPLSDEIKEKKFLPTKQKIDDTITYYENLFNEDNLSPFSKVRFIYDLNQYKDLLLSDTEFFNECKDQEDYKKYLSTKIFLKHKVEAEVLLKKKIKNSKIKKYLIFIFLFSITASIISYFVLKD